MLVQRSKEDRRVYPRHIVDWHASIRNGEDEIFCGRISDLSLGGAGIVADNNIMTGDPLVMLIETPLPHFAEKRVVTKVECIMCHTVSSSEDAKFRLGIQFLSFQGVEKHLLEEALSGLPHSAARRVQ